MTLYDFRCFGNGLSMHLEVTTHSENVHVCAELKTGMLAMPMDTGGLGDSYRINDHHCYIMLNIVVMFMLMLNCYFIILITIDHWFIMGIWLS
jgi:hypothetical protein